MPHFKPEHVVLFTLVRLEMKICAVSALRARSSEVRLLSSSSQWVYKMEHLPGSSRPGGLLPPAGCSSTLETLPNQPISFQFSFSVNLCFFAAALTEQIAGLRAQTGMEGFQPRCSRQLTGRPWEKQSKDCRLLFTSSTLSKVTRWHARCFQRLSKRCDRRCDATALTSRRACFDWLSKPAPSHRSGRVCSYNLQEYYGVLKEDRGGEYRCRCTQTCTLLRSEEPAR